MLDTLRYTRGALIGNPPALRDYLNEQLLGIVASYQSAGVAHHIGVVYPKRNNQLQIFIPRGHELALGSLVTVHLDNRTGVDELDAELRVYRTSYKGRVLAVEDNWVLLEPLEYAVTQTDACTPPAFLPALFFGYLPLFVHRTARAGAAPASTTQSPCAPK